MTKNGNGTRPKIHRTDGGHDIDVPPRPSGHLMIIGGADRLDPEARLAKLFVQMAERAEANSAQRNIVLITTATRHPEILTNDYVNIYTRLGISRARILTPYIRNRDEAMDPRNAAIVREAAGIFITGGDQYALTQALDRTLVEEAIREAYGHGAVVAGTSAGATAMGRPMIVAGGGGGELRKGMVQMSHGLAWAGDDLIIDTHFGARGRFPRLASVVAEHPHALGVGIDENTCLLMDHDGRALVIGVGVVYFVDASNTDLDTAPRVRTGQPISVSALNVHILAAGQEYNLRTRQLLTRATPPAKFAVR
ncbi:MAG: cyanophycinase [Chloroflexia bacterium]